MSLAVHSVLSLALLLAGRATAQQAPPAPSGESTAPAASAPATPATAEAAPAAPALAPVLQGPQPPDGKWSTDAEGRQYFPYEIPKFEGHYVKLPNNQIQIDYGTTLDVLEEKEKSFVVKIYRTDETTSPQVQKGPTAEERAAVEASYKVDLAESDALRFVGFGSGLPNRGQWRQAFEILDFDGDGNLDIVHGPPRKGSPPTPVVFLGDGKGHWRMKNLKTDGAELDYGDIAVADFNGDKRLDIALAVHLRGIRVLVDDGKGGYTDWSRGLDYEVSGGGGRPPEFTSRTLSAVDWNTDGRPDLLAIGEGPRLERGVAEGQRFARGAQGVVVFLNQGDGSWQRRDQGTDKQKVHADALLTLDLDGDGRLDFVTGSNIAAYRMLLNYGQPGGGWKLAPLSTIRPGTVSSVTSSDFDGDKRPDLAMGYIATELGKQHSGVDVHLQEKPGTWKRVTVYAEDGNQGISAVGSGDLDGDGDADLVVLAGDGRRMVFLGDGKGGFTHETSPELVNTTVGCRGYDVRIRDLDGDGRGEVVAAFAGESGSEVTLGAAPLCRSQGAIEAWKVELTTTATATAKAH